MSSDCRTEENEESIYNLVPRPKLVARRPPVHMSKYRAKVRHEARLPKIPHKTLGYEKLPLRGVDCFLKAHEKEFILPPRRKFCYPDAALNRPAVIKNGNMPDMGYKTNKDFIAANAIDNIQSIAAVPHRIYVDTRIGDKNLLDSSGLTPKYVCKKTYGKTPPYVLQRNAEMQEAKSRYAAYVQKLFADRAAPVLPEGERIRIIEGLKTNWEKANHEYLGMSMIIDNPTKLYQKESLEALMNQLERDIDLMESHSNIYVH